MRTMSKRLFAEQKQLAAAQGVFTLALGWKTGNRRRNIPGDESFEVFLESVKPGKLAAAQRVVGDSKVRKGRWVAEHLPPPPEIDDLYAQIVAALRVRGMPGVATGEGDRSHRS